MEVIDFPRNEPKEYSKDDFLNTSYPYEFILKFKDEPFKMEQYATKIQENAVRVGVKNFKTLFASYCKTIKDFGAMKQANVTEFVDQLELDCGEWKADQFGVSTFGMYGEVFACNHPITITERLINIDTNIEKLKLAYQRDGKNWRYTIVDKKTLASSSLIIGLADKGILVNSENAKYLIKYLHDLEFKNYERIQEKKCVSRLGWIENESNEPLLFAPYVDDLQFDGDYNLSTCFSSVHSKGSLDEWKRVVKKACEKNTINKIIIGAAFASVMIKHLGINNFMVHLWGESETGKSVALMMGASVWADPTIGKYIQSFNSTNVGRERTIALVNNLPLILDELQIIKDKKQFDQEIYTMCEGVGRLRGHKNGGTEKTSTWQNCILSNGEMPITSVNSGSGAVNRILEIECKEYLFEDAREFCSVITKNYGHAGKYFIENINIEDFKICFKSYYLLLEKQAKTEKQSATGAIVLTGFLYASLYFFDSDLELTYQEISEHLINKRDISAHERAYEYLLGWVSQNINNFRESELGQSYGKITDDRAYIINTMFNQVCHDAGYNPTALLSYLKSKDLIVCGNKTTTTVKINKVSTRCVCLKLLHEANEVFDE